MKIEYVNPFIDSTKETMSTMLQTTAVRGKVSLLKDRREGEYVSSIIGISGAARGTVALTMPTSTALAFVNSLLASHATELDAEIIDGIAELVNIVAGAAKAKFANLGFDTMSLGLPMTIKGSDYKIALLTNSTWIDVPFSTGLGEFSMQLTFEAGAGH